jgi:hypothetical protein
MHLEQVQDYVFLLSSIVDFVLVLMVPLERFLT